MERLRLAQQLRQVGVGQPVTIEFWNWGHFDLSMHGGMAFTSELVLDDVMINAMPEPASIILLALAAAAPLTRRRIARSD